MDTITATRALNALAQESRLEAFRLLVRAGPDGLPAGAIARHLGVPHNTLSTHLGILLNGGLLQSRRSGRSIIYRVDFTGLRALLGYVIEDCCLGQPDVFDPALDDLVAACCGDNPSGGRLP